MLNNQENKQKNRKDFSTYSLKILIKLKIFEREDDCQAEINFALARRLHRPGASSGIGKATKDLLEQKGATVYNLDRTKPGNPDEHFIPCEINKKEEVNSAIDKVFEREKKIDLVVCQ